MSSRSLGSLTIDLIAKIGGFTAGMDKAARHTEEFNRRMRVAGQAIGASLAAGFGVAAAGMAIYIKNTIEAEKVQAQLAARLKDTGGVAGRTLDQLNAQAEKLQKLTVFDDESIGRAQATLLTFKNIAGVNFDDAVEATTDLATVLGTELPDAAKVLGKALADPERGIGALRKAGVLLTDDQQHLIKVFTETGRTADAQRVILDALEGTMGSAAEASRDTLGGALEALQNSFDNLLEGDGSDNGVRGTKEAIEHLAATMDSESVHSGFNSLINLIAEVAEKAVLTTGALANLLMGVDAFGRSAGQAKYDANLNEQEKLRAAIAAGGVSPFDPTFGMSLDDRKKRLAVLQAEADAYRKLQQAQRSLGAPAAAHGGESAANQVITIGHDPNLWKTGGGHGGSGSGAASKLAAEAARAQEQAVRDLQDAYSDLNGVLEAQAKAMGGPALDAATEYRDTLVRIQEAEDELGKQHKLDADAQAQIAMARDQATAAYQHQLDAIQATKSPLEHLLDDQQRELALLGLTGPALQTASDLYGASAEDLAKYGDQIRANNEYLAQMQETIAQSDELRASFQHMFVDVFHDGVDAVKAWGDALVEQLLRIAAQQASDWLFGPSGSSGGGLFGGFLGKLFGKGSSPSSNSSSLFDLGLSLVGGHARGTDNAPGGWSWVGEEGPELMYVPRGAQITPASESKRMAGGFTQVINNTYRAPVDPRTRDQVAKEMAIQARMAMARL